MKKYKSRVISIRNVKDINKPNEDYFFCDDVHGVYIIVDGVSRDKKHGVYPNPSPAADVSKIFVNSAYDYYKNNYANIDDIYKVLFNMMRYGNEKIKLYNSLGNWDDGFLPGTVGIIGIIKGSKFSYIYIGDCYGFVINKSKKTFTSCQTEQIIQHKREFDSRTIRNIICNNKDHPYSYGVLNGDERAMGFLEYGEINLHSSDKLFLCTDGFYDALDIISAPELYNIELEKINQYSSNTDDKTLIIIEEDKSD